MGNYIAAQELRGILRKMAGDDLRKTVEIVQGSWQKIVLQSAFYTACIGREWQLSLRFDARRAQTQRSWSPRDAPTAQNAPRRKRRDRRAPRGTRASDVGLSQGPHLQPAHAAAARASSGRRIQRRRRGPRPRAGRRGRDARGGRRHPVQAHLPHRAAGAAAVQLWSGRGRGGQ